MTTTTTRRALIAGAAMLPALAIIPATAVVAGGVDPIFAAIERHRKIEKELSTINDKITAVEDEQFKIDRRPIALIAWRRYSHIGGSEIARARREFLNEPGADRAMIEREYREKKTEYRAALKAEREWDKKHGVAGLHDRRDECRAERDTAGEALGLTRPTTIAGAAALVAYARADLEIGPDFEWPMPALGNAVAALKQLDAAVQS
jgi:hypothetical protein